MRRLVLIIIGIVLIVLGGVWLLQGLGILPGSAMTGVTKWAVIGSIAAVVGIVALVVGVRTGRSRTTR